MRSTAADLGWPESSSVPVIHQDADFHRIRLLPRRRWEDAPDLPVLVDLLSRELITPEGYARGERVLPQQAACFRDAHDLGYLVAPIEVGGGKTLVTLLMSTVLQIPPYRTVLLLPAHLVPKTRADIKDYARRGFRVVTPRIVTYSMLSRGVEKLTRFPGCIKCIGTVAGCPMHMPELFLADEGRSILGANTPKRYLRWRAYKMSRGQHPFKFIPLDGTLNSGRNLEKVARLIHWAIPRELAPVPMKRKDQRIWADALNEQTPDERRPSTLPLIDLWAPPNYREISEKGPLECARDAFGRRFTETPGVVASYGIGIATALLLRTVRPPLTRSDTELLRELLKDLREKGELPGGKIASSGLEIYFQARALASGFYYVWDPEPPPEWLIARRRWASLCRALLAEFGQRFKVYNEAELILRLEDIDPEDAYEWREHLEGWREIRDTFIPNSKPKWVHRGMLDFCANWLKQNPRGVVWSDKRPFCERLSKETNIPYFSKRGQSPDGTLIDHHKGPAIASVRSCHEGHNIQKHHDTMLVVSCYERGDLLEQMIGRHHRTGQESELVTCNWVLGVQEQYSGLMQAIRDAKAIQLLEQRPQRLAFCDKEIPHVPEELP